MKYIIFISLLSILILGGCSQQKTETVCSADALVCPDGSAVGRDYLNNCSFKECPKVTESKLQSNDCKESDRNKPCTKEYVPVCGLIKESLNCLDYPCYETYSNKCMACLDSNVISWTLGSCPIKDLDLRCNEMGGKYLPNSNECEEISLEACTKLGGRYNECASACRNNPNAEICTLQCVPVCEFKQI